MITGRRVFFLQFDTESQRGVALLTHSWANTAVIGLAAGILMLCAGAVCFCTENLLKRFADRLLMLQAMRDKFDAETKGNVTDSSPSPDRGAASQFQQQAAKQATSAKEWFKKASAGGGLGSGGGSSSSSGSGSGNGSESSSGGDRGGQGATSVKSASNNKGGGNGSSSSSGGGSSTAKAKPAAAGGKSSSTKASTKPFIGPARPPS
jgi:hypothetical protein